MSFTAPAGTDDKIQNLRNWCYINMKSPWSTYHLRGINENEKNTDYRIAFVAFEFNNEKEAMKFQLYVGK